LGTYQHRRRTACTIFSHRRLDRQRDDRVGRVQREQQPLFEHRRDILRAIWCYSNTYGNCDPNSYSASKSNTNIYAYFHAQGDADAEGWTNTAASAYRSTAPVAAKEIVPARGNEEPLFPLEGDC
jgi:hypothetical protein